MCEPEFRKTLIHPGSGELPHFQKNTKAVFHFRTIKPSQDGTDTVDPDNVIDDTRTLGSGPFELLVGRDFKLQIWEEMVKSMKVEEVARFVCPFETVFEYPRVSKALRELAQRKAGKEVHSHHHCSFSAMQGTGDKDLDKIVEDKLPLMFEFELLRVEQPGEYKKDHWAMTEVEKNTAIPVLREKGNALYKAGEFTRAAEKYFEALSYLEEMVIKEKPESDAWNAINQRKIPLLLNYSQCKLLLQDYAEVIRHTTTVLEYDGDNVKALYRRGRAHAGCWNVEEAKSDFARVVKLDPSLSKAVDKELRTLMSRVREKDAAERERLKGKMF